MANFENSEQQIVTVKARADKAINSLKGILLGIISSIIFQTSFLAQENPYTEDLLKRIEALEAEKNKTKDCNKSFKKLPFSWQVMQKNI